jgi:hypothetical protein
MIREEIAAPALEDRQGRPAPYDVILLPHTRLQSSRLVIIPEINMDMRNIAFGITTWSQIAPSVHQGEAGIASWRTQTFDSLRVRMVEYSPGYRADHWCTKGHILLCLDGELHTELADGRVFTLTPGVSYQVADNAEPHRSYTTTGARLFIVD